MIAVVLAGWLGGSVAHAQTATLEGRVTDSRGGAVVGATVTAASPGTAPTVTSTDGSGTYRFTALVPGAYAVVVTMSGFRAERHGDVVLSANEIRTLDVQLTVGGFAQQIDVVGVAPLPGTDISPKQVPALMSILTGREIEDRRASSLADALYERLGAVTLEGATTNVIQPTLRFRGFAASPLLGLPQGIAVYQNGVRINEPFGDTVQFDLIPQFALNRVQLSAGAGPTYGLSALGGALALDLKDGFDASGFRGELLGGSFHRFSAVGEYGANRGPWAVYAGASRFDETGWRAASPSKLTQAVADLAYRKARVDAGVSVTFADSNLNGNGSAPVELLDVDRSAVFTFPDTTENRLAFLQGRFNLVASPVWSLQVTAYYRDLDRDTLNGDAAELVVCDENSLPPGAPENTLCLGADDDGAGEEAEGEVEGSPLVDARARQFITEDDAEGDGAFNRTTTRSKGYGLTFQATAATDLSGRKNVLTLGASADLADVDFTSNSEVGTLTPDRTVSGSGLLAGIFGEAPDDRFNTAIATDNRAFGLYFNDTLSLTERAHVTISGRLNHARIEILDALGTSLDGEHAFARFNVGVGVVHELGGGVSAFGRYSESNRAPTAVELSCADPAEPCRVPNAFVSDPSLEQAVARSVEGGLRGDVLVGSRGGLDWSVAVYRTAIADDILFVSSPDLIGSGFFQNAGDTRRIGLDAELSGQIDRIGWFASYGLVQATFESPLDLPGNADVNDAADEETGAIDVQPGDRLPGIPRHSVKAGVSLAATDAWDIALDVVTASSRIFVGDEGNDQVPLDGYAVANLRSSYRLTNNLEVFVRVDNLLDTSYATFGGLAELEVFLAEAPDAKDPRFIGPGAPRSGFAGFRLRF